MSRRSILPALAFALALPLAGDVLPLDAAAAAPCLTCQPPPPVERPAPDPPVPDEGDGTPPDVVPTTTKESETHRLSVETPRGRVTDGSGLGMDCPGVCARSVGYERTCTDGACPSYHHATIALMLTREPGYTARWDGCTPRPGASEICDVLLDRDRPVRVIWTKSTDGASGVDEQPLHDGGAVVPGDGYGGHGTTVSGTVETAAAPARLGAVRSTVRYSFRRAADWTNFTLLQVRHIPAGATTRVTCSGGGCPRGAIVSSRASRVTLDRLTGRRYPVGTAITVRVSHPRKRTRTTRMIVRRGKDPRITHP